MTDRKQVPLVRIALPWIVAVLIAVGVPSITVSQQEEPPTEEPATEEEAAEEEAAEEAAEEEAAEEDLREAFAEAIVVTGTRKEGLEPTETLSPVDVVSSEALADQGTPDLTESLAKITPSFNTQRFPIADGTSFIRPVTLRNLSPDQTLILVNGTRRHRSALVNLQLAPLGTVNQGAQAVDFSTLPAAAIERIEILRDGASAQYGSDAIAGVVNVILKEAAEGRSFSLQSGEYFEGDGARTTFSGNAGFGLGAGGFLNATVEYTTSDITSRGVARPDAAFFAGIVGPDQVPLNGLGQRWGDPEVEAGKLFLNAGIDITDDVELYSFASYVDNETISDFFYREAVIDPQQPSDFPARTTLQIDADGDGFPDSAPQSLVDSILAQGLNPSNYLVADASSPSGFVLRNPIFTLFPGGYNPNFGADMTDLAGVLGVRGTTAGGLRWDARGRFGENEVEYTLSESINPSLGALSPTSFNPGTLTQEETSFNLDFTKPLDVAALTSPLNVAFGLEYRDETYKIGAGDLASRDAGPTAAIFGVGSDGFQGFPIESAGSFSSESYAAYLDLEADLTDRFSGGIAARFEDYDVFGSTFDWKVSGRFDVTDKFALRGTANTGFRAPTPGQVNTLNVTTTADTQGNLIPSGVYPVDHPVALALGAIPLEPEDSTNFTVGLVVLPIPNTSITLDYYQIEIDDRLALENNVITAADVPRLRNAGVANPELLVNSLANFFSNAFDSEITGVDLAITTFYQVAEGLVTVDLRHNFNEQEVSDVAPGTINASRVFDLENQVPEDRSVLTVSYDSGNMFAGFVRANRYGGWQSTGGLFSQGDASDVSSYGSEILVDLETSFRFATHYEIAIGGENVFDAQPDDEQDPVLQFLGVTHSLTSPFGINGGLWYARIGVNF
jgi:iron complex outermembrane receptor protein